jgi:mercuric ion transport protein
MEPGNDPEGVAGVEQAERRGRRWIFGSFVFCPCHLPVTLAIVATVFGGTALGALLRDHALLAGVVLTAAWVVGTARGFMLVRMAQRGSCPVPASRH